MKPNLHSKSAVIINTLCILIILGINTSIAHDYVNSTGKTQALFGLKKALNYSYKYYLLPPQIIAIVFTLLGIKNRESLSASWFALIACLLSVFSLLLPLWKYILHIYP